jgi:hypothetical protein
MQGAPQTNGDRRPEVSLEELAATVTKLRGDHDHLLLLVQQLQAEQIHVRETMAALQAERTELLHALNSWAWQQVTPEEARRWAEDEEEGLTFDELLHSLDQATKT